ncbi:MAG: hypothetical protein EXX96DRAFT_580642 [Benjaminiella poitrasii]|nr:MAG: hypothetical protein EXX96DRAFT_580642 [Benjaminiella poitrasii]
MSIRHLSLTKSVIIDVIKAIVSRPIPNPTMRTLPLTSTWGHFKTNVPLTAKVRKYDTRRLFSTQPPLASLQDIRPDAKESQDDKRRYHCFWTTEGAASKLVKGFTMKSQKRLPKTVSDYNQHLHRAVSENRINKAISLLREMERRGMDPDVRSYTIIIDGFTKRSDMARARKWLQRMMGRRIKPDAYIYTSVIDGYMQQSNIDETETIFKLMMKKKIKPTLVTYNVLMHHSVRQLNMESALKFWGNLLEAGLKPDVYTFAIMLHGLGDEGRVKEAWKVYGMMQEDNVNVNEVIVTTLMGMHVKQHENEYAVQLYKRFFESKESTLKMTAYTRNVLLNAVISNADLETINNYYDHYKTSVKDRQETHLFASANVVTYTTFMRAFLRRNALSMVCQVYEDMVAQNIQPTLVTYATLMLAHAYLPDPEVCNRILHELRQSGVELNAVLYTIAMRAWAKAGRWEKVKSTYDLMKQDNIKPTELTMEALRYGRIKSIH